MGRLVGRTSGRLAWAALAFAASACSSGLELSVDLRTDYRPGVELDEVEVVWEDAQGAELGRRAVSAGPARDFVRGERLVDLAGLSPGRHRVRVTLLRRGVVVASRETLVRLSNDLAITVLVTRDCAEVRCPPAGAPARAACVDGRCVDPTCRPGRPDACPPPGCAVADDCPAPAVPCLRAACVARVCFEVADDTRCGPGGRCDPTAGCAGGPVDGGARDAGGPDAGPVDAGPCAASERACDDGLDEDCDHAVDCADDDCGGRACDDGDPCTHGDVCTGGRCEGTAIVCADDDCVTRRCDGTASCVETPRADGVGCTDEGNPCTDDVCGGGRCTHPSRTGTCPDDGNPCTTDLCSGGACTHPSRPDGTSLGGFDRCCGGAPVDVSSDPDHCGACGLRCSGSYACTVYDGHPTCDCGAANSECHGGSGFLCSTSYGVCACLSDAACPGSADCVARAGGPDYCTY